MLPPSRPASTTSSISGLLAGSPHALQTNKRVVSRFEKDLQEGRLSYADRIVAFVQEQDGEPELSLASPRLTTDTSPQSPLFSMTEMGEEIGTLTKWTKSRNATIQIKKPCESTIVTITGTIRPSVINFPGASEHARELALHIDFGDVKHIDHNGVLPPEFRALGQRLGAEFAATLHEVTKSEYTLNVQQS